MENNQPRRLSQADVERIKALPVRSFRVAGELRSGYYDEETRQFYETVDGKLTGKVAKVSAPAPSPAPQPAADDATPNDGAESKEDGSDSENEEGTKDEGKKKKPLIIGGIVAGAVVFLGLCVMLMGGDDTPSPDASDNPGVIAPVSEVHVVQVVRDLLPGHILTPDDVQECVLSSQAYSEAVLYGRNFCTYNELDKLVGNYLAEYIPAMQFLEQDSIQAATPFGINPWGAMEQGTTFITVPVAPDVAEKPTFGFGSIVDVTVRRTVSSQVAVGDDPGYVDIPGVTHTSTVGTTSRTEEVTISGLCVADVLNANNESIYEQYAAYMGIPLGSRLDYLAGALQADEGLWERLTPAYVKVRVTDAQAVAVGDTAKEGTTVTLQDTNGQYINTDAQAKFASEGTAVKTTLFQAKAQNEQKAADELAELQKQAQENGGES